MKIVVLEGPDNLGKTLQAKKLVEQLQAHNLKAEYVKFPNESLYSGQILRIILNGNLPFDPIFFQALQTFNRLETIRQLDQDGIYIFDRWVMSSFIYGASDGVSSEWIAKISKPLPTPDMTFLFIGKPFGNDGDIYGEKQKEISNRYQEYAATHKEKENIIIIDANQDIEKIAKTLAVSIWSSEV